MSPPVIAFFDVDETLIATKSMFAFLRSWLRENGDDGTFYARRRQELQSLSDSGAERSVVNCRYYEFYAGQRWAALEAHGRRWFDEFVLSANPFVSGGLQALSRHQAAGHTVALVSGSFSACLDPVRRRFGAQHLLCTRLEQDQDGRLTGGIKVPMIGKAKSEAVLGLIGRTGVDPAACYAYGDHASDLAMLEAVGHPSVVGSDPVLLTQARMHGWPILSGRAVGTNDPLTVLEAS
jgi:HAD superfamily hydrolase (TIGR01490 family)